MKGGINDIGVECEDCSCTNKPSTAFPSLRAVIVIERRPFLSIVSSMSSNTQRMTGAILVGTAIAPMIVSVPPRCISTSTSPIWNASASDLAWICTTSTKIVSNGFRVTLVSLSVASTDEGASMRWNENVSRAFPVFSMNSEAEHVAFGKRDRHSSVCRATVPFRFHSIEAPTSMVCIRSCAPAANTRTLTSMVPV